MPVICHDFFYTIYIRTMSWQVVAGVAKPGQRRETRRLRLARSSDVFEDIDWVTSSLRGSWVQIPPPASQIYCSLERNVPNSYAVTVFKARCNLTTYSRRMDCLPVDKTIKLLDKDSLVSC
jgi:hypothetical protein